MAAPPPTPPPASPVPRRAAAVALGALGFGAVGGLAANPVTGVALALLGGLSGWLWAETRLARAARADAEARAAEANQRAQDLAARDRAFFERVSQEFRTPLTLILAGFRALQEEREAPVKVRREVAAAGLRNTARLLLVLHEVGALAAQDARVTPLRKRPVDLSALLNRVVANFTATGLGRVFEAVGLDEAVPLEADPHQLQTVFYAVLSAAFQRADATRGNIRLQVEATNDEVRIYVEDNGPAGDGAAGGTVGLGVVRELVGAHGGRVLEEAGGLGHRVTLILPRGDRSKEPQPFTDDQAEVMDFLHRLARPQPEAAPPADDLTEDIAPLDPERPLVLLLVANDDLRAWLKRTLAVRYAVVTGPPGRAGLGRVRQARPHLVVADAVTADGSNLVTSIRRDPAVCTTPIIALLTQTGPRPTPDPDGLSADDYLPLPFDEEELLARVAGQVRSRTLSEEISTLRRRLEIRVDEQVRELIARGELRRHLPQALLEGPLQRKAPDEERGERRWITAMLTGLVGFGDLTDRIDPDDLRRLLVSFAREVSAIAVAHGGHVDQQLGDSVLVLFGAPVALKAADQAANALRAAVAIRERVRSLAEQWHRYGLPRAVDVRTGVHTGTAVVGILGSELTERYTAVGPPVSIAARLQSEPCAHGVLCSLAAYAHVRGQVRAQAGPNLQLDGQARPLETWAIVGWGQGP